MINTTFIYVIGIRESKKSVIFVIRVQGHPLRSLFKVKYKKKHLFLVVFARENLIPISYFNYFVGLSHFEICNIIKHHYLKKSIIILLIFTYIQI